jgi:hypothetical protein
MNWYIFLLILFIQIALTFREFSKTCSNLGLLTLIIYIAHHAYDVYLFWAPLFLQKAKEYAIHAVTSIATGIHWFTYDNKCIATVILNKRCGYNTNEWLPSLKNMLGLRDITEYFQFIWMGLLVGYDFTKIYQQTFFKNIL